MRDPSRPGRRQLKTMRRPACSAYTVCGVVHLSRSPNRPTAQCAAAPSRHTTNAATRRPVHVSRDVTSQSLCRVEQFQSRARFSRVVFLDDGVGRRLLSLLLLLLLQSVGKRRDRRRLPHRPLILLDTFDLPPPPSSASVPPFLLTGQDSTSLRPSYEVRPT